MVQRFFQVASINDRNFEHNISVPFFVNFDTFPKIRGTVTVLAPPGTFPCYVAGLKELFLKPTNA